MCLSFSNSKTVYVCLSVLLMMLSNRFSNNSSYKIIAIQSLHPFCSLFFCCFLSNMIHGHQPFPSPLYFVWTLWGSIPSRHYPGGALQTFAKPYLNQKYICRICLWSRCNTRKTTFSLCLSMFSFIIFKIKILLDVIILVNQTARQIGLH